MSLAVSAVVVGAIGTGIAAYSAYQSGQAQKANAEYQAQVAANNKIIADYNANAAIQQGNQQIQAAEEQAAQHQGMIRAVMGAGGIQLDNGSSLRDQQGVAQVDATNKATITSNAARAAWNFTNQGANFDSQAQLLTQQANQAASAGLMNSFSSILSGASTTAANYKRFSGGAT
nr:hypothetical protein [Herbaspirillum sp. ASV7]